ncbi:MAG: hypothetical protein IPM48_12175 [Saprospiraceae bacterium]|nr:hypothetical protein [Saprospiraceae bacterium]
MDQFTVISFTFLILLALASIGILWWNINRLRDKIRDLKSERDQIRLNFDLLRKEKFETDEKLNQLQAQERTYKVAYEDWKGKYEILEQKYTLLKKEMDSKVESIQDYTVGRVGKNEQDYSLSTNRESPQETAGHQILKDLKSVLDQHAEVLRKLIADDKIISAPIKELPSDPLHWIMGIDEDTSAEIKNMGLRTFQQIAELPRKEIKKMMLQFEDIEDRVIESWPLQAGAILNSKNAG